LHPASLLQQKTNPGVLIAQHELALFSYRKIPLTRPFSVQYLLKRFCRGLNEVSANANIFELISKNKFLKYKVLTLYLKFFLIIESDTAIPTQNP